MRTAALVAAAIVVIGTYMLVGAATALPPAWIGLGMLAIAFATAASVVALNPAASR